MMADFLSALLTFPTIDNKYSLYNARALNIATDKRFSAHYIYSLYICSGLNNDLYDLYNDQQYTVHCRLQ